MQATCGVKKWSLCRKWLSKLDQTRVFFAKDENKNASNCTSCCQALMLVQVTSCLLRKQKLSLNISKCMHISRTEEPQQITSLHELHVAFQRQELHCLFFTKRVLVQDRHILINLWRGWKLVNDYMPFLCILWWYFKGMSSFHISENTSSQDLIDFVCIHIHTLGSSIWLHLDGSICDRGITKYKGNFIHFHFLKLIRSSCHY